uniref:hypothetical protein n=1 Tax=Candidatus Scatocola faecigallinarum TaxID=2840916 RepID=UPI0040265830
MKAFICIQMDLAVIMGIFKMKKFCLVLAVFIGLFFNNAGAKDIDGEAEKFLEDVQKSVKRSEEMLSMLRKLEETLDNLMEHQKLLCLAWFFEQKMPRDLSHKICECEREKMGSTMATGDIIYFQENFTSWNFRVFTKEEKASRIDEEIKKIRLKCIEELEETIKNSVDK